MLENTTPSNELPRDFCAGIGPLQLGLVLVILLIILVIKQQKRSLIWVSSCWLLLFRQKGESQRCFLPPIAQCSMCHHIGSHSLQSKNLLQWKTMEHHFHMWVSTIRSTCSRWSLTLILIWPYKNFALLTLHKKILLYCCNVLIYFSF